ncbi:MAG: F0F1 ATP synthase subunit A [Polyangiaceae bacterium]|jgi:F-type H+-transporting ATPase subunit a|nr:F0F1 ATP synthase subunit A [Polyangiaceae bacterium]
MPDHTSLVSYLIHRLFPNAGDLAKEFGHGVIAHTAPTWRSWEPPITAALLIIILLALGVHARSKYRELDRAVVPEDKLTVRTFLETFLGYFYGMARDVMGPERAKRYFPIIGAAACFVFIGNVVGLIPGLFIPPTSSLNITLGCSLMVFVLFNYYGIKANGVGYLKHMAGPWLGPLGIPLNILIFIVEVISTCVRPITLSVRLMLNMAVDHLLAGIFLGLFALLVPVPVMFLGVIVILVQTLVFTLLSSIYIALATEHEEHDHAGGHAHAHA